MTRETDLESYPQTVAPLSPAHIRHCVRQMAARKARAMALPAEPDGHLRSVARDATREAQRESLLTLARYKLAYFKRRAGMRGGYGCGDPSARRQWNGIAHGVPIRFYDYAARQTVERVTP